jgi:hypothetical protein
MVFVLVQDRCMVCTERTIGLKSLWMHPMELLGDVDPMESRFSLIENSVSVGVR